MGRQRHWKAGSLALQVERAISLSLLGDFADDVLQDLMVADVREAADPGAMDVFIVPPEGSDAGDVQQRVLAVSGALRQEVARAIHRRKTPRLNFRVIPAGMAEELMR